MQENQSRSTIDYKALMEKSLIQIKTLQSKLKTSEKLSKEPIAIIGMSCRFPGGVETPEEFWQLLNDGVDGISEVPSERWNIDDYYDPAPDAEGKMYTRDGGFISQIESFDAEFFGIAPREAQSLDPQQRLLLEVSWQAIERANLVPEQMYNSLTGVFIGIASNDYMQKLNTSEKPQAYWGTGNAASAATGRLSYVLGLTGPNMAVETACSSSLVSVHLACQSLRQGECNMALAGGVNLLLSPQLSIVFSKAKMLSPDGRCKTFDAEANGYVRSEGCGIIVLKRLSDALVNGDNILAVIRGTAVNQDGPSGGLTVPNGPSQVAVIRKALENGGVDPSTVSYIEAHGTGTALGDPIEVEALGTVFGKTHSQDRPLIIGAVKTNIGHLEMAAGIAGLMKVVLQLQEQKIAPSLHFQEPNPHINWSELPVQVSTQLTPWQRNEQKTRIAGVSSFGFSGTNAHVVLEEAAQLAINEKDKDERGVLWERPLHILTLSAKKERALGEYVLRYQKYLDPESNASAGVKSIAQKNSELLADICYAANTRRTHFNHRMAIVASQEEELAKKLRQYVEGEEVTGILSGEIPNNSATPKIAFLFTGQGSQYVNMGRQLYESSPVFREALDECDNILRSELEQPLLGSWFQTIQGGMPTLLDRTAYTQPALFAIEYALFKLWQSWGIEPDVVMGHSVGEYVAAYVAGVFSLEDGLKLIATRGRLMQQLPKGGVMVSLMASSEQVKEAIADREVAIAAINGPESTVISGVKEAVQAVISHLEALGIKSKPLQVSHAFHSPLMEPMLAEFEQVARQVKYSVPKIKMISNVTGQVATEEVATPEYWCRHIVSPVNFAAGMETLHQEGYEVFLECGPKPILLGMGRQCLPDDVGVWLPSLRPGLDDWQQMLTSLGELYVQGVKVDWVGFERDYRQRRKVTLPTYPFQRQRYWVETKPIGARTFSSNHLLHPLLGQKLELACRSQDIVFETSLSAESPAYLCDHCILDKVVFPGAAYVEMALAAGAWLFKSSCLVLEDVAIARPLILSTTQETKVQLVLSPTEKGAYRFEIASLNVTHRTDWQVHASGKLRAGQSRPSDKRVELGEWTDQGSPLGLDRFYQQSQEQGIAFGSCFQALKQAWLKPTMPSGGTAKTPKASGLGLGQVQLPTGVAAMSATDGYQMHPVVLDAGFQMAGAMLGMREHVTTASLYLPIAIDRLELYGQAGSQLWVQVRTQGSGSGDSWSSDMQFVDSTGLVVTEVKGLRMRQASRQSLQRMLEPDMRDWLYALDWQAQPLQSSPQQEAVGGWILFTSGDELGEQLLQQLRQLGYTCVQVSASSSYQQLSEEHYQVNPSSLGDFKLVLQACFDKQPLVQGIIHLWSLESARVEELDLNGLQQAQVLGCGSVLHLLQSLPLRRAVPLQLVTKGAQLVRSHPSAVQVQQAPLWGLGRVITLEYPEFRCQRLDLDPEADLKTNLASVMTEVNARERWAKNRSEQVAYRQGQRLVARLGRQREITQNTGGLSIPRGQPYQLKLSDYGSVDYLSLQPMTRRTPGAGEVEVRMQAVGLNFRDVLNSLGLLKDYYAEHLGITAPEQLTFGFEGVGLVTAIGSGVWNLQVGDEVMVVMVSDAFSSHVILPAEYAVKKPQQLSVVEAATIPLVFLTAQYGLKQLAQLKAPGSRVLIHSAAGGVGQAAVQIARQIGAEIYATASPQKWEFLRSQGIQHIFNSRSLEFAEQVLKVTGEAGVHVVLNSLNGEYIPKSLELLAEGGKFIEIGKAGIWSSEQVRQKRPDVAYFPFDLGEVGRASPQQITDMFEQLLRQFELGELQPLRHQVYPIDRAIDAFRLMQRGQHVGKVVITQQPSDLSDDRVPIHSQTSYLIAGGLGALGLQVANWLVDMGAHHLVLMGRRTPGDEAQRVIASWEQMGVTVSVQQVDVTSFPEVSQMMERIKADLPPLRGVFHAAGVLEDALLQQMSWQSFERVMAPKVQGGWNLHRLTQDMELDFFVCFSSIAAVMGNASQGNYAAANAFMDALMQHRRTRGLPGLSIQWGPWERSGMAASLSSSLQERMRQSGFGFISRSQGCQLLGQLLASPVAEVAVMPINWSRFRERISAVKPSFLEAFLEQADRATFGTVPEKSELMVKLQSVLPEERTQLLIAQVQKEIARVLGISDPQSIEPQQQLFDLGLDSLMALELRNRLQSSFGKSLSPTVLFDNPTLETLVGYLGSEVLPQAIKSASTVLEGNLAEEVEALSLQEASFSSCLVPLQSQGDRSPFFCVHPYAGVVFPYIELARLLGDNQPFYGLQAIGLNKRETPLTRIEDMAAAYVAALRTVQSRGPYRVGGWSTGAPIAFEMARQLQKEGCLVDRLVLIDMPAPLTSSVKKAIAGVPFLFGQVLPEIWPYVADYLRLQWQLDNTTIPTDSDRRKLPTAIAHKVRKLSALVTSSGSLTAVLQANTQAIFHYTPGFYDGKITLLRTYRSVGGSQAQELTLGWQQFSSQAVQVHFLPGHHLTLLRSPHVRQLAEVLQSCLPQP